jgi:hypothetical protein
MLLHYLRNFWPSKNSSIKLLAEKADIFSYYIKPILQFRNKTEITKHVEI